MLLFRYVEQGNRIVPPPPSISPGTQQCPYACTVPDLTSSSPSDRPPCIVSAPAYMGVQDSANGRYPDTRKGTATMGIWPASIGTLERTSRIQRAIRLSHSADKQLAGHLESLCTKLPPLSGDRHNWLHQLLELAPDLLTGCDKPLQDPSDLLSVGSGGRLLGKADA